MKDVCPVQLLRELLPALAIALIPLQAPCHSHRCQLSHGIPLSAQQPALQLLVPPL